MKTTIRCCLFLLLLSPLSAQEIMQLYPGAIPNSKQSNVKEEARPGMFAGVTVPTLEAFLPEKDKATGAAVVICPGGGYSVVVYQGEGVRTAKEFARNGIAAFVLKYRLPSDSTMIDKRIGPLQDAEQAMKIVRERASEWGIDPHTIGIMGFSAGGHLASTEATHYDRALIENGNQTNLRPDFQILVYPVISMQDSLTHQGSRDNLLGKHPSKEDIDEYSNELQVTDQTPPAYIIQAGDDKVVDVDNSIVYYEHLRHHNVFTEMHLYPKGNHGFVLFMPFDQWLTPIVAWIEKAQWKTGK
ncbi:MAG TPA: alpha/beta hydrolase [Bacteroidota bacterium]|nr:alpha/beta hydrolase [Bacteroidota bacterium]